MAQILTVQETARRLQLSADVVREYLRQGKIPGRKIGKVWRVLDTDLEHWISTGQSERPQQRVSALGFLTRYEGRYSSEEFMAEKRAEIEREEARDEARRLGKARRTNAA